MKRAMPDPDAINFTHEPGKAFQNSQQVQHVAQKLADGRLSAADFPAIRVYRSGGSEYSLDNRRLKAYQLAGVTDFDVQYVKVPSKNYYKHHSNY